MYVELQNSEDDLRRFIKSYFLKRHLAKRFLLLIIISLVFGFGREAGQPFIISNFIFRTVIEALVLLMVLFIAPYLITVIKYRNPDRVKHLMQPQKIILNNEGISIVTRDESIFWKWETLNKADIVDQYLFFTLFTKKLYLIPIKFFSSENEAINFLGVIKSSISKFKGESKPRKINNLYYWSLVGFIPNFGVIAGIILIVKGFQYNEIKLMLLGVVDILLTVFFWTIIFPHLLPK